MEEGVLAGAAQLEPQLLALAAHGCQRAAAQRLDQLRLRHPLADNDIVELAVARPTPALLRPDRRDGVASAVPLDEHARRLHLGQLRHGCLSLAAGVGGAGTSWALPHGRCPCWR